MQHVTRLALVSFLTFTLSAAVRAAADTKESEYKRSDTSYYFKSDVLKAYPDAVIIDAGKYKQKGDSYFVAPKAKPAHEIYIQVTNDWIEPITPPTMPTTLGVAPDAMEIREPQGDVQVALPSAPANFQPVQDKQVIPNGAVVKTGANGTAAVLMGGVDSIRLIPNSSAAVQQTVGPQMRATEIDLTQGAVFSKVGKRIGEKQDYQVHTPFGVAAARGTDFVTVALAARTDVWIAQGTVQLNQPDGKLVGTVSSEGTGALKIIRFPVVPDAKQAMLDGSETMTAAFNFIPTVNVYVKQLDDKMSQGLKLTPTEQEYLNRIKKVPCLIKLALVEPPAPPPAPPPPPPPAPPAPLVPINVDLRADGQVNFQGATYSLNDFKAKLQDLAKTTPKQPLVVTGQEKVKPDQLKKVVAICRSSKLKTTVAKPAPVEAPPPAPLPTTTTPPASPGTIPPPAATPTTNPVPPTMLLPPNLDLRPNGKVDFQGATYTLDELKSKLEEFAKTSPNQSLVVTGREKVAHDQVKKVVAICHAAKLKVTLAKPASSTPSAVAKATTPEAQPSTASTPAASTQSSTTAASTSAPSVASDSSSNNSISSPARMTKTKSKSTSAQASSSSAPISAGPNYTVP